MKIALIVPGGEKDMGGMGNVARPPLGVCYLKAYLSKEGLCNVKIFHQINETNEELITEVLAFNPDVVGFSVMSCAFANGLFLAEKLKEAKPHIITVFGGEHVTGIYVDETKYSSQLMSAIFQENQCIDFLIPFEGEVVFEGLVAGIQKGKPISEIPGIAFWKNGLYITPRIERLKCLDILPMADRSDLPYEKYHSVDESSDLEYMHTARGCKFNCSYCATPVSNPGNVAKNSANRILKEIEFLYHHYGRKSFFFCDELFTADIQRIKEFCKGLILRGLNDKISWRVFARVDDISTGRLDLKLMKKSGLNGLFFGVESMNPVTLKKLGKGTTPEQTKTAITNTYNAGIDVWCSLMLGYPWENEAELKKSLDDYLAIKERGIVKHTYVAFITPFPGTRFYRQCIDNGWIKDETFLQSDCSRPVLSTPISKERLIEMYKEFLSKISRKGGDK